jgi:hypothetical protein
MACFSHTVLSAFSLRPKERNHILSSMFWRPNNTGTWRLYISQRGGSNLFVWFSPTGGKKISLSRPEPEFVNLLKSPGIDSQPGGPVRQPYLTYRPARLYIGWRNQFLKINSCAPSKFKNTGTVMYVSRDVMRRYESCSSSGRNVGI